MCPQIVVVTGVAGFVGSNLAKHLLRRGYEVRGIDNLSAGTLENIDARVDFHQVDIRDVEIYPIFEGADAVFHLAAKNCLPECAKYPLETASINVTGTVNVLEAARMAKVRKFIYADTSAEYEGIKEFPTAEKHVRPLGIYAASKHSGATFCESYREQYGMKIVILRYFNVYGPAQDWRRVIPPVMSSFILRMLQGQPPIIYGTGKRRRDFVYVDDVNDFHLIALVDDRADGNIYNVGSGVNYSVNEIYDLIEGLLGSGLQPIYKSELPGEAEITLADLTAAKNLGWTPSVQITQGLSRTIKYLQTQVANAKVAIPGR
jgi:nucleoside-diphosphate-sugar epimerase